MADQPKPAEAETAPAAEVKQETKMEAAAPSTPVSEKKSDSSALPKILIILVVLICACLLCSGAALFLFTNILNQAGQSWQNAELNSLLNSMGSSAGNNNPGGNDSSDNTGSNGNNNGSNDSSDSGLSIEGNFNFGGSVPSDFPNDVPIYAGSTVSWSSSENGEVSVTFATAAKASDIVSFYKAQMPSNGYSLQAEVNFLGSFLTYDKGNREVVISVIGDESSSETLLTIVATNK